MVAPFFRRLLRNAGTLLGANVLASALGFVAFAIAARALGAEQFGVLALVLAYVTVIDTVANFQSWQALIKYGAEDLARADSKAFAALVKFGTLLDLSCALAGTALAILLLPLVMRMLDVEPNAASLFLIYSVVIATRVTGTATAVLRLFDRFDLLASQQIAVALTRVCLVGAALLVQGTSLRGFVLAWATAEVLGNVTLLSLAWRQLHRMGYRKVFASSARWAAQFHAGLWSFVWTTNLQSSLKLGLREADTLALGALVGPAAAGLYKVVKQVETVASRAFAPLTQALYPELAAAAARRDRAGIVRSLGLASVMVTAVFAVLLLLFAVGGKAALHTLLGAEFGAAYAPAMVYLCGTLISAATFGLQPTALALGIPQQSLRVLALSTIVYAIAFGTLATHYGLMGAALAYVVFYVAWSALMIALVRRRLRELSNVQA